MDPLLDDGTIEPSVPSEDERAGIAREVAYLYEAGLDRDGDLDEEGLNWWIDQREAGLPARNLAEAFLFSDEFEAAFGASDELSDEALVAQLYLNVLDRPGEPGGLDYWTGELAAGLDRPALLLAFALSAENVAGSPEVATLADPDNDGYWTFGPAPGDGGPPQMAEYPLSDDVMFVGHSLVTNLPVMLEQVVADAGGNADVSAQNIPGANLQWNWENAASASTDARAALPDGDTEVLVITEALPLANHTTWSGSDEFAALWYDLAVEANPEARVYLYETWHSLDSGTGVDVPYDENDDVPWRERLDAALPMWEGIADAVNAARDPGQSEMLIVPAGQAMALLHDEIAAGQVPGVQDIRAFFIDDIHPNDLGLYFVTMVQYATIYGRDPAGLDWTLENEWGTPYEPPSPDLAAALQRISWEAVCAYRHSGIACD